MPSYDVAVVNEDARPVAGVVVEAIDLSDLTVSATATTDRSGLASFASLVGSHFFRPRVRRVSGTVGGRHYTGAVRVQVVSSSEPGVNVDYVVDSNGAGTHLLLFGATGALEAAIATGGDRTIWVCTTHSETVSAQHALSALADEQKIIVLSGGRNRPVINVTIAASAALIDDNVSSGSNSLLRFEGLALNRGGGTPGPLFQGRGGAILPDIELVDIGFEGTGWTVLFWFDTAGSASVRDIIFERVVATNAITALVGISSAMAAATSKFVVRECDFASLTQIQQRSVGTAVDVGDSGIFIENNLFRAITGYGWTRTYNYPFIFTGNVVLNFTANTNFLEIGTAGTTSPVDATIAGNYIRCSNVTGSATAVRVYGGLGTARNISIAGNALRGPGNSVAIRFDLANTDCLAVNSYRDWTTNVGGTVGPGTGTLTNDHGTLLGLGDDDHTQYLLLAGRAGGQTVYGGIIGNENLRLRSTPSAAQGVIEFEDSQFFASVQSAYAADVMADSPNLYWRLGEAAGTFADAADNDNTGSPNGGITYGVAGAINADANTAITLNGTTGFVSTLDHADLDLGDVFTLEAWIAKGVDGTFMSIIAKGTNAYQLRMSNANTLQLLRENVALIVSSTATITGAGWHHVAATKTGATVRLYIDGVDVTGVVTNQTFTNTITAFHVGRRVAAADEYFNGSVDEVAVYPTALTAARILSHYNAGATGAGAQPRITCDTGDFITFNRTTNQWGIDVGGLGMLVVGSTGLDTIAGDTDFAIQFIGGNPLITADVDDTFTYVRASNQWRWNVAGNTIFAGDASFIDFGRSAGAVAARFNSQDAAVGAQVWLMTGNNTSQWILELTAADTIQWREAGATSRFEMLTGGHFRNAGYTRVGSATVAPANTTAGDLTCARLNVGNVAFPAGIEAYISGDLQVTGQLELDGDLNHDGSNIGFFGVAPVARAAAYTVTNALADRAYDANATTVDELADVLGTLIADLQAYGLLQ